MARAEAVKAVALTAILLAYQSFFWTSFHERPMSHPSLLWKMIWWSPAALHLTLMLNLMCLKAIIEPSGSPLSHCEAAPESYLVAKRAWRSDFGEQSTGLTTSIGMAQNRCF